MKICLIELMPFPYTVGGGTTHIMNLGNALGNLGHEVHVISSRPAKEYKILEYPDNLKLYNVGMRHKKFTGGINYYAYRLMFELSFVLGAKRVIDKIKPDVIDCQSSITTALPAALSKYPFVITCHGIHSLGFGKLYNAKKQSFVSKYVNKVYEMISKYNVRKAKKLLSQGEGTLKHYCELAGDKKKGRVVPNMVDTDFWEPSGKRNDKIIVTAARFTKQKSLDKLILAMKLLKGYKLRLIGGGDMDKELREMAPKNVEFLGVMDLKGIRREYLKARYTILPSEFEGFPYSILESMASGLIPIVTKVGDLAGLINDGKNGFFLKDNKPETIANTLKKIKKDKLKIISRNARKTILKKYSSLEVAKNFLKIYKSL